MLRAKTGRIVVAPVGDHTAASEIVVDRVVVAVV